MPPIRTDDAPRRLRAMWLGPRGARWPVDWTYPQWGVFVILLLTVPPLIFFLVAWWDVAFAAAFAFGGPVIAYRVTTSMPKWVNYDRPLRWWVGVLRAEFSHSTRLSKLEERRHRVSGIAPVELSKGAQRALYPATRWVR